MLLAAFQWRAVFLFLGYNKVMSKIYITRQIPGAAVNLLQQAGHEVAISPKDGVLTKAELISELQKDNYEAVLSLLTDKIDGEVLAAAPTVKIVANYAVGFDNIDLAAAKEKGIVVTNTPGVLTNAVAEFATTLILAAAKRVVEADQFMREGKYDGWAPELMLGLELKNKTLGIIGTGRIGSQVAGQMSKGFGMKIAYYDVSRNDFLEKDCGATFYPSIDEVLKIADAVSIHVPLLESTKHLINAERLALMKSTAILVNTSRGSVVDEQALVKALQNKQIAAAGLDVFEFEPKMAEGLAGLPNVIVTPHIASATVEARGEMSEVAAKNIIAVLAGGSALNPVA